MLRKLPKIGTAAYHDYLNSWQDISSFFSFILSMVSRLDGMSSLAHTTLVETCDDPIEKERMIEERKQRVPMVEVLKNNRQFLMETLHVRVVDNFLNYISSLLFEIYRKKPVLLRSSEMIDFATLIDCGSMQSLVHSLAEIKTSKLVYKSYSEINKYFLDGLGVKITDASNSEIIYAIELRNIIVHNRCVVDKRFIRKTKANISLLNKKHSMHLDLYEKFEKILLSKVIELDVETRKHLKICGHKNKFKL
ncbi:hypothetical protein [Solidesulfovibrio sp.]